MANAIMGSSVVVGGGSSRFAANGGSTLSNLITTKCSSSSSSAQKRFLNLHEYQSKELMREFGVAAQEGWVAKTPAEAKSQASEMIKAGIKDIVMKAQIFAGGRGKGTLSSGLKGGVQFCQDAEKVRSLAEKMLGYELKTHQTGDKGMLVEKVLLHEGVKIDKEFYLAIILDNAYGGPVIVASRMGGVDIEEVAQKHPEAITMTPIDILKGPSRSNVEKVIKTLIPEVDQTLSAESQRSVKNFQIRRQIYDEMCDQLDHLIHNLYNLFKTCDASQVEINPLAITSDNQVLCVDAKLSFDDNAVFRQKKLFDSEDLSTRDPKELEAEKHHLNFVSMEGNIGCLVNGAGLAMATMDIVSLHGESPANFLDVGGGATQDQVQSAFSILKSDPNVKAIFVNIFGGITRCDEIAKGIVGAATELGLTIPLVVRLIGNRESEAKKILNSPELKKLNLNITFIDDFGAAATKVCDIVKKDRRF